MELALWGADLRYRPVGKVTPEDIDRLRKHKDAILLKLRLEKINPFASGTPLTTCDRCGASDYLDITIHGGRSTRRDCGRCNRFMGWPRWNLKD